MVVSSALHKLLSALGQDLKCCHNREDQSNYRPDSILQSFIMSAFLLCTQRDAHGDPRQMKELISSTAVSSLKTSMQRLCSSARGSSQQPPEIVPAVHGREPACCFCHTKLSPPPHPPITYTTPATPILTDCLNIRPCRG